MFVAFIFSQGSFYSSTGFGDGGVVATGTGLSALFCCDMDYELCGIVTVHDPFELDEQFRE